jgi:hypothetical protein
VLIRACAVCTAGLCGPDRAMIHCPQWANTLELSRLPTPKDPCAAMSMLTYYRTSRTYTSHFGQYVPFLDPNRRFGLSVGTHQYICRIAFRLFVASLQSTSFVVSPAEGEGAPGSSGPVHSGYTVTAQEGLCRTPSRNPRRLAAAG